MTTDQDVTAALAVVAATVLHDLALSEAPHLWEHHPEIGEHDWMRVLAMVLKAAPAPDRDEYRAAYALLTVRAEQAEEAAA